MNGGGDIADSISDIVEWVNAGASRAVRLEGHCAGLRVTAEIACRVVTFSTESPGLALAMAAARLRDEDGELERTILREKIGNLEVEISGEEHTLDRKRGQLDKLKGELDDKLRARALVLVGPHVTEVGFVRRRPHSEGRETVELGIKTQRMPADQDDCDALGTEYPSDEATKAAEALALEFGRRCSGFHPTEKGWGYYEFLPWK